MTNFELLPLGYPGYRSFASVMANGDTCIYLAEATEFSDAWEIGVGEFNASSGLLNRLVLANYVGDTSLVDFSDQTEIRIS